MASASNPPVVPSPWKDEIQGTRQFNDFQPIDLYSDCVAGAAAGNISVNGIRTRDILNAVIDLTTGYARTAEFTISASDTINNTGGTTTSGHRVLVIWTRVP
jgi:hypothetical protein